TLDAGLPLPAALPIYARPPGIRRRRGRPPPPMRGGRDAAGAGAARCVRVPTCTGGRLAIISGMTQETRSLRRYRAMPGSLLVHRSEEHTSELQSRENL